MNRLNILLVALLIAASGSMSAQERNFKNLQKLTFGGDNAEAYFSPDGSKLVMQVTNPDAGVECDQIYTLNLKDSNAKLKLASTGLGRTTCSYFMPDGKSIVYASTHKADKNCPPKPKPRSDGKYLWPSLH